MVAPSEPDEGAASRTRQSVAQAHRRRSGTEDARAEDHVRDRVRAVSELGSAVSATAAQVERPDERRRPGRDVHRSAASKVEVAVLEAPAGSVPGPVRHWVVADCGPEERDDEDGEEASALGDAGDGDDGRQRCEHCAPTSSVRWTHQDESRAAVERTALVKAEEEGRDLGRANGGRFEDALEAKVVEVADERGRGRVAKCERVTPASEEPVGRSV